MGGRATPIYRVYVITESNHITGPPSVITCADDHDGLQKSETVD
jgi:hypothetical protein